MQCARCSNEMNPVQQTTPPEHLLATNQLNAMFNEHNESFEGFQLRIHQVHQSVVDLQHHILNLEYMMYWTASARQQKMPVEYAEHGGTFPLYRDHPDVISQQQQQLQQQPATALVDAQQHHYHYQVVSAEEAHVSSIPNPPPPTPVPQPTDICYEPRILNAHAVEQGRLDKATVYYTYERPSPFHTLDNHQENSSTVAMQTGQHHSAPTANPALDDYDLNDLLNMSPAVFEQGIASWGTGQENYRQ